MSNKLFKEIKHFVVPDPEKVPKGNTISPHLSNTLPSKNLSPETVKTLALKGLIGYVC